MEIFFYYRNKNRFLERKAWFNMDGLFLEDQTLLGHEVLIQCWTVTLPLLNMSQSSSWLLDINWIIGAFMHFRDWLRPSFFITRFSKWTVFILKLIGFLKLTCLLYDISRLRTSDIGCCFVCSSLDTTARNWIYRGDGMVTLGVETVAVNVLILTDQRFLLSRLPVGGLHAS